MRKNSKSKTKKRVTFITKNNERREISLSSGYSGSLFGEFKELVKLLSYVERFGTRLSERDAKRVESLPTALRKKLIDNKLIIAKLDEKIPTLIQLIEQYKESRSGMSVAVCNLDKRVFSYLIEYFGKDTRIDMITPAKAAGIRNYLMNVRKAGRGKLWKSSTNKAVIALKPIFKFAVGCGYLQDSPFANVKGGLTTTPDRFYYVTFEAIERAIRACGDDVELAGVLAFARYAGLRIPSEIRDLRFTSFSDSCFSTGVGTFEVPTSGKTGTRCVPFFAELIPYLKAIREKSKPEQEFVFNKYRNCKNIGTLIKKKMCKAGLNIWEKFFINQRSSCQTDKERLGWSRFVMDSVFGNSEPVRLGHYIQPMEESDYAKLGQVENGKGQVENGESLEFNDFLKQIPTVFPTFPAIFGEKITFSDMLAIARCDENMKQKTIDFLLSDPDLSICYANISALFEMINGKQVWELPAEEQIKRANTFVQSAAQHFAKPFKSFDKPLDRVGLEPTT